MPKATQLSVLLENKPGTLAKLTATLAKAGVNILAFSVVDNTDAGLVRMVVDSAPKAKTALTKAGFKPLSQTVIAVNLKNEPGAAAQGAATLAAADVNIAYAYGSVMKGATEGLVIMAVDDVDKALAAIGG